MNLHFGGDFPAIFTTQVTSIEEDMMELTKYPDLEVIYIDFEYKGIPKHLPLEKIEVREAPAYIEDKIEKPVIDENEDKLDTPTLETLEKTSEAEKTDEQEIEVEEENIDDKLRNKSAIFGGKIKKKNLNIFWKKIAVRHDFINWFVTNVSSMFLRI